MEIDRDGSVTYKKTINDMQSAVEMIKDLLEYKEEDFLSNEASKLNEEIEKTAIAENLYQETEEIFKE
ncbi:9888_t:CDS:2, partial [Acaulospora colombiana]